MAKWPSLSACSQFHSTPSSTPPELTAWFQVCWLFSLCCYPQLKLSNQFAFKIDANLSCYLWIYARVSDDCVVSIYLLLSVLNWNVNYEFVIVGCLQDWRKLAPLSWICRRLCYCCLNAIERSRGGFVSRVMGCSSLLITGISDSAVQSEP